jgi:hypothetical protein
VRNIFPILAAMAGLLVFGAQATLAAPFNATNNPNIVANYDSGTHGIISESETHTGMDVVMRAGNSGNFQQWFLGTSSEDGFHGDHSLWQLAKDNITHSSAWILVQNAFPSWGDYLMPEANYWVHTNDFHMGN